MRRTSRAIMIVAAGGLVIAALACDCPTGVCGAGPATVSLVTPNTGDRAILVTITGPGLENIKRANSSHSVHWRLISAQEARVVVFGNLTDGPVFTINVPDREDLSGYSATVLQVADRNNRLRESTAEYEIRISAAAADQ